MARSAEQFQAELLQLPPPGWAISRDPVSLVGKTLLGWAQEMARFDARIADLWNELDPRTTIELMPEWQRMVGLPDPCCGAPPSMASARAQLLARLDPTLRGQSIPVLVRLAASFGYAVTITEPVPITCDSDCDAACYDSDWAFVWLATAAATPVNWIDCDSTCDEAVSWWGNQILECVMQRRSPPDTILIFLYGD